MDVLNIISHIGVILLIINTIVYLIGFIKNNKAYKYFSVYLLCISTIQVAMTLLAYHSYNNHFLSGYYLFAQFILLSCFFYHQFLPLSKKKSVLVKYLTTAVTVALIVHYFLEPGLYFSINPLGFLITSVILVAYSVMYLFEHLTQKLPFNYVTIGIFMYLISSAIIFATSTTVIELVTLSNDMFKCIWIINAVLCIIYQLLILWEWKQHFFRQTIK
ncbi:MAG: hypothetical protein V4581_09130 [Bacteroidota bacterium]